MNRHVFVVFLVLVALNVLCTLSCGSSIAPWNSVTNDASDAVSVDIPLDGSAPVEFSVTAGSSYEWTWSVNGEALRDSEGKTSQVSYVFDDYGHYNVTAVGTGENETVRASWNVTVWLVIGEENDLRELEGLEDYILRITKRPERIVSMAPSCTELLFAVGAGDQVVGVTEYCDYPPEVTEKKRNGQITVIGGYTTPSLEKIVALEPDLIVGAYGNPDDLLYWLVDESAHRGITYPVYAQNPRNIGEILTHIEVLGAVTGCEATSSALVEDLSARLEAVEGETKLLKDSEKPRVYYTLGEFFTAGDDTFSTEVIELAGGRNIAAGTPGYFVINLEELVARNPQVIICDKGMGSMSLAYEEIMNDPRLQVVEAVKNNWVYIIDGDLMGRPGPRVVDAVERVHDNFYDFFTATSPSPEPTAEAALGGGSSAKSTPSSQTALTPAAPLGTKATRTVPSLAAGEEVTMVFEAMDISLLTLKADSNVHDVVIVLERIERPFYLPEPPGTAYAYFELTVEGAEGAGITGSVEFRVPKSWLHEHAVGNATITLNRDDAKDGWTALPTTILDEDEHVLYCKAELPAFSIFCITAKQRLEAGAPASPAPAPSQTPSPTTSSPVPSGTPVPDADGTPLPGFDTLGAALALLVVFLRLQAGFKSG